MRRHYPPALATALLLLAGCGTSETDASANLETVSPSGNSSNGARPEPEPAKPKKTGTSVTPEPEPADDDAGYRRIAREMDRYYPGEGWGDVETISRAVDNVCEAIAEGSTSTEVARFYSEQPGADPIRANALVGYANDYVCEGQ